MENFRQIKNSLTWHNEGKFEVELVNGIITKLNFCEPGKGPDDTGKSLTSINFKYLQAIHACLGDLFAFIEEENKKLGYSYARVMETPQSPKEEFMEDAYLMPSETKLRPLINYDHQPEPVRATENEELSLNESGEQQNIGLSA